MTQKKDDDDRPFPAWGEPATKGDVLKAMIWTQSLIGSVFGVIAAVRTNDVEKVGEALARYDKESNEFRDVLNIIAGRGDGRS